MLVRRSEHVLADPHDVARVRDAPDEHLLFHSPILVGAVTGREHTVRVADAIFEEPKLAEIYDSIDGDRSDLAAYVALVEQLSARSILDLGCGTGTFACLLAARDREVIAIDPAAASLAVARR
jgi:ubiquinone/menaquinone biosynthesis C-methylase UbiE